MSNNPPYATINLNQAEFEYLGKLLTLAFKNASGSLSDVAGMSSDDPRSKYRSMLIMAAGVDVEMTARLVGKVEGGRQNL